jgi:hypothetical protein
VLDPENIMAKKDITLKVGIYKKQMLFLVSKKIKINTSERLIMGMFMPKRYIMELLRKI